MLGRSPGFHGHGGLTLAIGVGLNTTISGFVYAVLKPLPVADLSSLVTVYMTDERNPGERGVSRQNYADFAERNDVLDQPDGGRLRGGRPRRQREASPGASAHPWSPATTSRRWA